MSCLTWCLTRCHECRAKKEQSQSKEPTEKDPLQPEAEAAAKAAKASSSAEPKTKQRRKSGLDKSEKDIQHVLYKVIGQVSLTLSDSAAVGASIHMWLCVGSQVAPITVKVMYERMNQ
jgi:hypothetical protein